jgi:iron complex transport system substrate-binding protein
MALRYADQFSVDYEADGTALVTIGETDRFLVVPEGNDARDVPGAVTLRLPLHTIYAASSAAPDPILRLGTLDAVRLTGTKREDWTLPELRRAMDEGEILYAGKYSAPDYELLLLEGTELAIENTMIYHSPETKEQLEALGIPVLVERSSYEAHPLGRTEWVKLYAAMLNKEEQAAAFFDEQAKVIDELKDFPNTEQKVAFFYVSTDGSVVVRGAGDYVAGMIELAGGRYIFSDNAQLDSARAAVAISMEDFYAAAVDAEQDQISGSVVLFDDLMGDPGHAAADRCLIHDD